MGLAQKAKHRRIRVHAKMQKTGEGSRLMTDFDILLEALDEMTTHQLEQLNRLLEAVRRYLPRENLTRVQQRQRAIIIGRAVTRLRAGMTDAELESLIRELRAG
jgi:hypothetical protein